MNTKLIFITLLLFGINVLGCCKEKLPVIKSDTVKIDVKDGKHLMKNYWKIQPEINPDIFTTSNKDVTFYTDMDSIHFKVKPGKMYDFVILLNGKDSAHIRIQYAPGHLDKLKNASGYNFKDERFVPKFTYESNENKDLERLRDTFNLDSIAGQGNEISKMINLMYWVHDVVRHDGSSNNPKSRNAIDIINICKAENRGVNCRMMATILNECYLALGFKSRFVTCMPKETEFSDCHVINMVFSNELQKWVWMDPTFCAYVMDEKGELLGLSEVRERLISGKTLIINPDANWNKRNTQTVAEYLGNYMAKNLYRMECHIESEYNTETYQEGKQSTDVELLPLDGIEQEPQKAQNKNYTHYKTNNPDIFWAKPED